MSAAGYQPLALDGFYNAGVAVLDMARYRGGGTYLEPRPALPPLGNQMFHGLPFSIGEDLDRCFIAFPDGSAHPPVTVPVAMRVHTVIFAHCIYGTELWQGGPVGNEVAGYSFTYADGTTEHAPIRERFEIGHLPTPWGQYPFLAVPDQQDHLFPRYEGRWEQVGFRMTEVGWAVPQGYYLWPWHNPRPDDLLETIEITPRRPSFLVAAITVGTLPEEPFTRSPRRPIKVTLLDPARAATPFATDVTVDRGAASYAYPVPPEPIDTLEPAMRGFGLTANTASSPAYSEVSATSSATVTVHHEEELLAEFNWGELERDGSIETPTARVEIVEQARNWVRVNVTDADTGRPLPCRISFHSPDGVPYAPHGHQSHMFSNFEGWNVDVGGDVRLGQLTYAFIDGSCEGWLPRGDVIVDIARGYEYEPIRQRVTIAAGQTELALVLSRWIDMKADGWWSGDTHVHFLSAMGALHEAACEDLNVVNLLQAQWGHLFTNREDFTGEPLVSDRGEHVVHVSQENRNHILGHLGLLGLKKPVMPWSSGGPTEAELGGSLEVTLSHWADEAHAQGGTVVASHLPTPNGEPATLIATGRVDAVEMLDFLDYEHHEYYRYLNGGYRLPLVGGTDKMANTTPVGLYRTYAHLPDDEPFTYDTWMRALRSGRTFLSGGALLWLTVEGHEPGDTVHVGGGGTVEVEAVARSVFPIHTLQIVRQGNVVAETTETGGSRTLRLDTRIEVTSDTWLAARCAGPGYTALPHHDDRRRSITAHTSPVYVRCGEEYSLADPDTLRYMLTLVEGSLEYVRHRSRQYPSHRVTHRHGLDDHMAYLERPFHEAREALMSRLQEGTAP